MFGIIFIIFRSALSPQNSHKSLCHSMLSPNEAFQICPQTANVQAIVYTKSHLIQSNPMYRPHNMLLPQSFSYQNAPQPYLQQCCRCQVFPHTSVPPKCVLHTMLFPKDLRGTEGTIFRKLLPSPQQSQSQGEP